MARSTSDGEWRALDGVAILKTYRLAAGYLYEAQLRHELSRSLGLEWATPEKGWAELKEVPRAVIDAFSRRRAQIVERMAEQNMSGFHAAKVAALATRERKESIDLPRLREQWAARTAEHGLGQRELQRLIGRAPHREPTPAELLATAERLLGPEGLTEKQTAFSEPELAMAWAQAHTQGVSVERVRELCERLLTIRGVQRLTEPAPGRPASYSTLELLELERSALELVERGLNADAPSAAAAVVDETMKKRERAPLSAEQEAMVRAVVTSTDRVLCVVGPAGAGKTTATHAVAEAFQAAGAPVIGAAPSGIAAERLQDETGIPSQTLHRLLVDATRVEGVPEGCVLIVDEAAMAETRVLAPILSAVEQARQGDPDRRPAATTRGWRGRALRRHRRTPRRGRADREPAATRRAREARAPGGSGRTRPRLPRLRRPVWPSGRLEGSVQEPGAPSRRRRSARATRSHASRRRSSPPPASASRSNTVSRPLAPDPEHRSYSNEPTRQVRSCASSNRIGSRPSDSEKAPSDGSPRQSNSSLAFPSSSEGADATRSNQRSRANGRHSA